MAQGLVERQTSIETVTVTKVGHISHETCIVLLIIQVVQTTQKIRLCLMLSQLLTKLYTRYYVEWTTSSV